MLLVSPTVYPVMNSLLRRIHGSENVKGGEDPLRKGSENFSIC